MFVFWHGTETVMATTAGEVPSGLGVSGGTAAATLTPTSTPIVPTITPAATPTDTQGPPFAIVDENGSCSVGGANAGQRPALEIFLVASLLWFRSRRRNRVPASASP
jgi:hypothetical protein